MNIGKGVSIWRRSNGGRDLRNEPGQVFVTGLAEMHFVPNPMCGAFGACRGIQIVGRKVEFRRFPPLLIRYPVPSLVLG